MLAIVLHLKLKSLISQLKSSDVKFKLDILYHPYLEWQSSLILFKLKRITSMDIYIESKGNKGFCIPDEKFL